MGTFEILICIVGGFFAGLINTFVGFGSVITLAIYMDLLAIPGHIANATNRVNILASTNIGALTFYKNGKLDIKGSSWIILSCLAGVLIGVLLATGLDGDQFKTYFKYLLVVLLIIILINPKKFINADTNATPSSKKTMIPFLFLIGIYAGFIQVGFGLLFLMVIVMMGKFDLVRGNALKIAIVAIYSFLVVAVFWWNDMINWIPGLTVSIGQCFGSYIAAKYMSKFEGANKVAYVGIILIIAAVLIKNFELYKIFF